MARTEDKDARAERLAQALRQNLHRRKAQARRRQEDNEADAPGDKDAPEHD